MLEESMLLVDLWQPAPGGESAVRVRQILDTSGVTLGLVRQDPLRWPRWLRWLAGQTLVVQELPDASLVFALRRSWGWPSCWHVLDADEKLVGTLRGRALLDGLGNLLAVIETADQQGRGRLLAARGHELANFADEGATTRITFAAEVEGNPFAKMMLLGAVLVVPSQRLL
jgi:hypothetical protein